MDGARVVRDGPRRRGGGTTTTAGSGSTSTSPIGGRGGPARDGPRPRRSSPRAAAPRDAGPSARGRRSRGASPSSRRRARPTRWGSAAGRRPGRPRGPAGASAAGRGSAPRGRPRSPAAARTARGRACDGRRGAGRGRGTRRRRRAGRRGSRPRRRGRGRRRPRRRRCGAGRRRGRDRARRRPPCGPRSARAIVSKPTDAPRSATVAKGANRFARSSATGAGVACSRASFVKRRTSASGVFAAARTRRSSIDEDRAGLLARAEAVEVGAAGHGALPPRRAGVREGVLPARGGEEPDRLEVVGHGGSVRAARTSSRQTPGRRERPPHPQATRSARESCRGVEFRQHGRRRPGRLHAAQVVGDGVGAGIGALHGRRTGCDAVCGRPTRSHADRPLRDRPRGQEARGGAGLPRDRRGGCRAAHRASEDRVRSRGVRVRLLVLLRPGPVEAHRDRAPRLGRPATTCPTWRP